MPEPLLLSLAADIVAAHVAHNDASAETLSDVIRSVYAALKKVSEPAEILPPAVPAVAINKSVFPDFIVCLEDGKKLKSLKRHLWSSFGLTPDAYRVKWQLPDHYPMVAPNYAARRSAIAKEMGLGHGKAVETPTSEVPIQRIPAGVRGRRAGLAKTARST